MDIAANIKRMAFPWYDSLDKQNFRKRWCSGDYKTAPLWCPQNKLLPFILKNAANGTTVDDLTWTIVSLADGSVTDLKSILQAGQTTLEKKTTTEIDYILYYATEEFTTYLNEGDYYSVMTDGENTWYSEVFRISCFINPNDGGVFAGLDDMGNRIIIEEHGAWDDFLLVDGDDYAIS